IGISAMVIENKVKTLTITTFIFPSKKVLCAATSSGMSCLSSHPIIILSDSDIKNTFSSTHSPDYIPASPNYFSASPRNISPSSSDNLSKYLFASLVISPLHDNPYMKAYNTNKPPKVSIDLPPVLPPSLIFLLSPMLNSRNFFPPKEIPPPKDTETPAKSPIPPPDYSFNEFIYAELDNLL
ncbi:hypothetical protein Tco_1248436, partial [Tanacetum coccineum]